MLECLVTWLIQHPNGMSQGVFHWEDGVPQLTGSEPPAPSSRRLIEENLAAGSLRALRIAWVFVLRQDYPDPRYYLTFTQKYFFRSASLRHLRVEQFNRYLAIAGEGDAAAHGTTEDTIAIDEEPTPPDLSHRNYDELMEDTPAGAHFLASATHVPGCKRRVQTRLGCSRVPFIEPIGGTREDFYEASGQGLSA